jgi:hypothetical protein
MRRAEPPCERILGCWSLLPPAARMLSRQHVHLSVTSNTQQLKLPLKQSSLWVRKIIMKSVHPVLGS